MNLSKNELLNLAAKLSDEPDIKSSFQRSNKAGILTGICSLAGGYFGGPMGLAVGGMAGSRLSSYLIKEKEPTLSEIIMNYMSEEQKDTLFSLIQKALSNMAIPLTMSNILANDNVKHTVMQTILSYMQNIGYKPCSC